MHMCVLTRENRGGAVPSPRKFSEERKEKKIMLEKEKEKGRKKKVNKKLYYTFIAHCRTLSLIFSNCLNQK